ncbi:hypothetical protein [Georgenia subflava]|uniref:hypothetical protein n=1 Tax=Georgenia subflava TaxID=1622177 RepID=UPI001D01D6B1|nr:hypothetical protein [Georgenia subflava]
MLVVPTAGSTGGLLTGLAGVWTATDLDWATVTIFAIASMLGSVAGSRTSGRSSSVDRVPQERCGIGHTLLPDLADTAARAASPRCAPLDIGAEQHALRGGERVFAS